MTDKEMYDLNGDGVISGAEIGSSDNLVPYENNEEMQAQEDEIFFNWTTGRSPEPYNDLNQNGMFDLFETFFDLNENSISTFRQSMLFVSILSFIVLLNYIYKFSISGDLEDFSTEIFKNKILLFLSSIIGIAFCLGYF